MGSGNVAIVTGKEEHLVVFFPSLDTEASLMVPDSDCYLRQTQKTHGRENGKRMFPSKSTVVKEVQTTIFILIAFKCKSPQFLSDSCENASTFKPEHERRHCTKKHFFDVLDVIHTVSTRFCGAVDYRTYWLANMLSKKYDYTVLKNINKTTKCMTVLITVYTTDLFDSISIIGFLRKFKLASDTSWNHEDTAIWLFHFLVKKPIAFALHSRLASNQKARTRVSSRAKKSAVTTFPQVFQYLLRTFATNENIADAENKIFTSS